MIKRRNYFSTQSGVRFISALLRFQARIQTDYFQIFKNVSICIILPAVYLIMEMYHYNGASSSYQVASGFTIIDKLLAQPMQLYKHFTPYVLDRKQMRENEYPMECPMNPGKAIVHDPKTRYPLLSNPDDRICSRCKERFTVLEDGSYRAGTTCCYHSGKRQRIAGIEYAGAYSCCGDPGITKGCRLARQHVSAYINLDKVKFVKTLERNLNPYHFIIALGCEMCYTTHGLEVARVSLVSADGSIIYDTFVLPENPIVDYNTEFSGITANHLIGLQTTLADVQAFLLENLSSSTILIGHSLECDLKALHLIHETVIDTSVVFAPTERKPRKLSLKRLALEHLQKTIQQGPYGHDSVEDARTCMDLLLYKIQQIGHPYYLYEQETPLFSPSIPIQFCLTESSFGQTLIPVNFWDRASLYQPPVTFT